MNFRFFRTTFVSVLVLAIIISYLGSYYEKTISDTYLIETYSYWFKRLYILFFLILSFTSVPLFVKISIEGLSRIRPHMAANSSLGNRILHYFDTILKNREVTIKEFTHIIWLAFVIGFLLSYSYI